jgi:hypothetical protein
VSAHHLEVFKPYAGWTALILTVLGLFVGIIGANVWLPLALLAGAVASAAFRFWNELRHFDFWALDEWLRTRRDALSVRQWHTPHHAAEHFCTLSTVMKRNEAAQEMNTLMMEMIRKPDREPHLRAGVGSTRPTAGYSNDDPDHARYDAAQLRYNQSSTALARELHEQLTRGDLLAKGLLMKDDVALAERVIPTSRWRVMAFDIAKASAIGAGWSYTGIQIGKRTRVAGPTTDAPAARPNTGAPPANSPTSPNRATTPLKS